VKRPLWRVDGSVFCTCYWPSPAQRFLDPSPFVLVTIFYSLIFETSLFVAFYDSQGHGGGIRPRLHTGLASFGTSSSKWLHFELESRYIASAPTTQKTPHAAAIVACLSHHCVATVSTLRFASRRIHWCAACCSATSGKHSYFYCCAIAFRGFCASTVKHGANTPQYSLSHLYFVEIMPTNNLFSRLYYHTLWYHGPNF
jgi:hypothetical protein